MTSLRVRHGRPVGGLQIGVRELARAVNAKRVAGAIRTTQNWISGDDYNPCGADFVPPPPEYAAALMDDLCAAINDDNLPPLVQAAVVHAQFATICPFADSNGWTARALLQDVSRRRGLAPDYMPPMSVVLASAKARYIVGLTDFREERIVSWVEHFAAAAVGATQLAASYLHRVNSHVECRHDRLRTSSNAPRADAAAGAVIDVLPAHLVLTASVAATATSRAKAPIYDAIRQLVEAGVLEPLSRSKRNQSWEAVGLSDISERFVDWRPMSEAQERNTMSPKLGTRHAHFGTNCGVMLPPRLREMPRLTRPALVYRDFRDNSKRGCSDLDHDQLDTRHDYEFALCRARCLFCMTSSPTAPIASQRRTHNES